MPTRQMIDHNPQIVAASYLTGWLITGMLSIYGYVISFDLETIVKISAIVTPFILFGLGKIADYGWQTWKERRAEKKLLAEKEKLKEND